MFFLIKLSVVVALVVGYQYYSDNTTTATKSIENSVKVFSQKLKTIAKIEGNNQKLTKFQHIQKVWSIVIITSLIILVFRDFV